jgi:hypothetical protein
MLAATVSFALFGLVLTLVIDLIRRDGQKIFAALRGQSWTAQPSPGRPVTIRFSSPNRGAAPVAVWPALRAAA